jgi:hypothetical protein
VDSLLDDDFGGFIEIGNLSGDAVGFFYASRYSDDGSITLQAFNGATEVFTTIIFGGGVNTSFRYFGLDGVGPITSVILNASSFSDFVSVAEISSGIGTAVIPEPATWAMMILGFGLVGFAARRRTAALA